jgi:hypothetical protein
VEFNLARWGPVGNCNGDGFFFDSATPKRGWGR